MKLYPIITILLGSFLLACKTDPTGGEAPTDPPHSDEVIVDNILGCTSFTEMPTEESFFSNTPIRLETLEPYFVYGTTEHLFVHDGFGGPVVLQQELKIDEILRYEDDLMICAEEGLYRFNQNGTLDTITTNSCASIAIDGLGRLLVQGVLGPYNQGTSYRIHEFKNNTLTPFANVTPYFSCISLELFGSSGDGLYAVSCDNELAYYENGVVVDLYQPGQPPFSSERGVNSGMPLQLAADGSDLVFTGQGIFTYFRINRFSQGGWTTLYDLDYPGFDSHYGKQWAVFSIRYNPFIHGDYLYTFATNTVDALIRFDISDDTEKTLEDIDLVNIPGLPAKQITGIVTAGDGHTYVVMSRQKIVRISC